ncbi:MAG: phosphoribosyltransferase [Actinobacteria bacterium]|nr:phosphoribosyltransferase [Actinomycetota bacterium]
MSEQPFRDRNQAGKLLANQLSHYSGQEDVLVLALPRGGVPVAIEVARALGVSMDIFIVRKLGVPGREELAMGAIASGDVRVVNDRVAASLRVDERTIAQVLVREEQELKRREHTYRGDRPAPNIEGRTVILIDDGLATGSTMRAAIIGVRAHHPAKLVVGVPVAASEICTEIGTEVDEVVCLRQPTTLLGIGGWYEDFSQLSDEEVKALLEEFGR